MNSFTQGLKDKIAALDDEATELEDSLLRVRAKLEMLEELLAEEQGLSKQPVGKKKRGRPKGSGSKSKKAINSDMVELYEEAVATLPGGGTTPELQEKLTKRYKPTPRVTEGLGPGIKAGTKKQVLETLKERPTDASISVEDE